MRNSEIQLFSKGIHNLLNAEIIPKEASQDSQNWLTKDGVIQLIRGKELVGDEGDIGKMQGHHFGFKVDGSTVQWRKTGTKIQYFDGTDWQDTITGLTTSADYTFANYSSLAGTFTFAFGQDGIYKMHNANPSSYNSMYDSTKNFKGYAIIDKGRAFLWNRAEDKTGIYGSWIDNQRAVSGSTGVYTAVSGEATTSLTGTLAFKAGGATRNCFGVIITLTGTGEVYTDNYLGVLTGNMGGTGTINYITGAYTISNSGTGTASYQWENSNLRGLTDFSKSATRLAGEGFQFPQDEGGDPILSVHIGEDGAYYSIKKNSVYRLNIADNDTDATNEVFRKELGIPSFRASTNTQKGIVFINTANPEKPEMTILQKNLTGDNIEPVQLFAHFKFEDFNFDDCTIDTYDRYVLVACRSKGAINNDTILMGDIANQSVDKIKYSARTFAKTGGVLFMGSSLTQSVYKVFNGFDDEGNTIDNYYTTKDELFETDNLKKYKKIRLKGLINPDQSFEVYANYDSAGYQLVGTIVGSGSYVDYTNSQAIGNNMIGEAQIGGDDIVNVYPYFAEIKLKKVPKFRKRSLKFIAKSIGYVDINYIMDYDIEHFENKLPKAYRQKQNVSLNGLLTNQ
jgi:hypothetical protein